MQQAFLSIVTLLATEHATTNDTLAELHNDNTADTLAAFIKSTAVWFQGD